MAQTLSEAEFLQLLRSNDITEEMLHHFSQIETVNLCSNRYLKEIRGLQATKWLTCRTCPELTTVADLPMLKRLNVSYSPRLEHLESLPAITELYCSYTLCTSQTIATLSNLQVLDCSGCTHIQEIPPLPQLRQLDCRTCPAIRQIQNFPKLTHLDCRECAALVQVSNLRVLSWLNTNRCVRLECVHNLPLLSRLECHQCPCLNLDGPLQTSFEGVRHLHLEHSPSLTRFDFFPNLETLVCIQSDVQRVSGLSHLRDLKCLDCPLITEISQLVALQNLFCDQCAQLEVVRNLPSIHEVIFHSCSALSGLEQLPDIRKLVCHKCTRLVHIQNVPLLEILYCNTLPELTEIAHVPNLRQVGCEKCPKLLRIGPATEVYGLLYTECPCLIEAPFATTPPFAIQQGVIYAFGDACFSSNTRQVIYQAPYLQRDAEHRDRFLPAVVQIQKSWRKRLRLRQLLAFVYSEKFLRFYYAPGNPGHRMATRAFAELKLI